MTLSSPPPFTGTLREGRQQYFDVLGTDGGYDDDWVHLKLGPIPFGFPNTEGRKRAVKIHDLHHVVTGYQPNWVGEFEISGWEIGSSCGRYLFAWGINLLGMSGGLLVAPRRTLRAFARGRRSDNLYPEGVTEELLDDDIEKTRTRLHLDQPVEVRLADVALFLAAASLGWWPLLMAAAAIGWVAMS